jgi:hypothetical protein
MKRNLVLRLIRIQKRIRKRERFSKYAREPNKFKKFIKQNEVMLNFIFKIIEFVIKIIYIFLNLSKTYFNSLFTSKFKPAN